jgi:hypothetical protein
LLSVRSALILLAGAALLLLPSLVVGTMISHSSAQNLAWAGQFADQFRSGILYPRWLPHSFDELGSPTFYFYPPVAFWIDALLSVATFDAISLFHRLAFSALILLWLSGLAMQAWLGTLGLSSRTALIGALAYMAAPYHLLDHYVRGAFAEFAAFAVLPLIALSIRRIADDRPFAPILLALSYAALALAHLPAALLVSVTALPLYVLYRAWSLATPGRALGFLLRCALGGALGLGVAALYLVPALGLLDWITADTFWGAYYNVESWFLFTPSRWPASLDMMRIIAWAAAAYAVAALCILAAKLRRGAGDGWWSEAAFWAALCLLCLLLIGGVPLWFWRMPFVAKVQFGWRLMVVVEFAVVTALCLLPWPPKTRVTLYGLVAMVLVLLPACVVLAAGIELRVHQSVAHRETPADVKEYEPAGFPQDPSGGYADLGLEPLQHVPTIACLPTPRVCRATPIASNVLQIDVDADGPVEVVLRRFYYPLWRLEPFLPVTATTPFRLVTFTAPAGPQRYRLQRVAPWAEKIGWMVCGASLLLLLIWAAVAWRGIRRT